MFLQQETHSSGPRTHTQPLSEQLGLTHDIHLVPQQVASRSSYSSAIERHSLNTGSSNSHGGMVRHRLYSLSIESIT